MREQIIKRVEEEKIIAIVRGVDKKDILNFAKAVYEGGIRLLEVTYNAADPSTDEETASKIKLLADEFEGKMLIGAGTVLNEKQVELTKNAGGKYIISPDTNEKVIKKTLELGLVSMPGAFTPTEAQAAHTYGADFVKIFPSNTLGLPYLKAIMAPLSHIRFLAVGGVDENNIGEFVKSGVAGFGIGSGIVNKQHIKEGNWAEVTALAKKYTDALK
ncbi:MAG: bifunctional 4-hydroxy-2-oxoglutarate aldolase/2-dehydro-3-deoxy-phosphogluconate aldolase [Ruminococcaceae bacterium]|nr:bifunctional 4-hydroxy-2-oxoglutarate aldolase/2-dehydro-3-deoxy-phosphogluconate aldolase [Oscillospiraceae bacterium]